MTDKEKLINYADNNDVRLITDYSGRCMYGATCYGVITDNIEDTIAELGITGAKTDNMGLSYIVYFPKIKGE